jgi:hypothetical protein
MSTSAWYDLKELVAANEIVVAAPISNNSWQGIPQRVTKKLA